MGEHELFEPLWMFKNLSLRFRDFAGGDRVHLWCGFLQVVVALDNFGYVPDSGLGSLGQFPDQGLTLVGQGLTDLLNTSLDHLLVIHLRIGYADEGLDVVCKFIGIFRGSPFQHF